MMRWFVAALAAVLVGVFGTTAVATESTEEWVACGASGWVYRVESHLQGFEDPRLRLRRHLTFTQHFVEVRTGDGKMEYAGDIPDDVRRLFGEWDLNGAVVRRYVATPEYLDEQLDRLGYGIYRGNTGVIQTAGGDVEERRPEVHVVVDTRAYSTMSDTTEDWWAYRCRPTYPPAAP